MRDYMLSSQRCLFVTFSDCSLILDCLCLSLVVLRVHHHNRYDGELKKAQEVGVKQGLIQGIGMGVTMMLVFFVDGLAFWLVGLLSIARIDITSFVLVFRYSGKLVYDEGESAADVIIVFFSVLIGAMAIGQGAPNFTTISIGRGAAFYIFKVCFPPCLVSTNAFYAFLNWFTLVAS